MALFKKKKDEALPDINPPPTPSETPTELVLNMRKQGMDNNAIIQALQARGFSSSQIFSALTQADQQAASQNPINQQSNQQANQQSYQQPQAPMPQPPQPSQPLQGVIPTMSETQTTPTSMPQGLQPQALPTISQPGLQAQPEQISTEDVVEAIIDEKWNDLMKDIGKIVDWKNNIESRITRLEDNIKNMQENFDRLHRAIVSRVGEYDNHLLNIHGQLKAFETALSKFLPVFSENVQELSAVVKALKGVTKVSRSTKK